MTKKLRPIQKELLRFIKELIPILEKNKIDYFACGGTMIGAVREKGFIEWDDDIDLFMTRPNYDKLLDLARKNNGKLGSFDVACGELENSLLPFCKIFDKRYMLNDKGVEGDEDYLFIDIFPLDAVPEDINEEEAYFKEILKKRKLVGVGRIKYGYLFTITKNKLAVLPKMLLKVYVDIKGPKKVLKEYLDLCKKYNKDYEKTNLLSSTVWGKGTKENITKDDTKTIKMPFEDIEIKVPKGYDTYLTSLFGDYMTPPKAQNRESHDIEIIKVKE